jgi:hypothetical protein
MNGTIFHVLHEDENWGIVHPPRWGGSLSEIPPPNESLAWTGCYRMWNSVTPLI